MYKILKVQRKRKRPGESKRGKKNNVWRSGEG
jgi:hypothetical protein